MNTFTHDFHWPDPKLTDDKVVLALLNENSSNLMRGDESLNADAMMLLEFALHSRYDGVQVWVSKEVSYDLAHTDISDPDFESVPWLGDSMEFVFEDPAMPSFLLFRNPLYRGAKKYGVSPRNPDRKAMACFMMATGRDKSVAHLALDDEAFNRFAAGSLNEFPTLPGTDDLSDDETQHMQELAVWAFKILFFASIPRFAPTKTAKKPTKKECGKPGFQNRPATQRALVSYVPHVHREMQQEARAQAKKEGSRSHTFRGRRGTLRTLRHECFTHKRWQKIFVAPIPSPNGEMPKRVFKVVKPKVEKAA